MNKELGRKFVIGDVHGTLTELRELISQFDLVSDDTVVFLGDIVDKGPMSAECIELAFNLKKTCNVVFVAGNHEDKHYRWVAAEKKRNLTGAPNGIKGAGGFQKIHDKLSPELWSFIEGSRLLYVTEGFVILHGGIPPAMRNLPDDCALKELYSMPGKQRDFIKNILWTRYVNTNGFPVSLGSEKPEDSYWADVYDGRFGKVLFGHQPFVQDKIKTFDHAIGLDLGCVYGGYLAAVEIRDGQIVNEYYVKAKEQWATPYNYQESE